MKTIDPSEIKILVCCHKKCELPPNPDGIFLPIHVGAAISKDNMGMQRDDQVNGEPCDNISDKNKNFCELTALYWAWKNIKKIYPNIKYIGLNHYRRYFDFAVNDTFKDLKIRKESEISSYSLNTVRLNNFLQQGNCILAKKNIYFYPIYIDYCINHISDDYRLLKTIIQKTAPDYARSFYYIFNVNNKLSPFNMFITTYEEFEKYCDWLFSILFEVEKAKSLEGYSSVQARIYGYMAERLFNVYIYHNNIKKTFLPIEWYNDVAVEKKNSFYKSIYNIKCNISSFVFYLCTASLGVLLSNISFLLKKKKLK